MHSIKEKMRMQIRVRIGMRYRKKKKEKRGEEPREVGTMRSNLPDSTTFHVKPTRYRVPNSKTMGSYPILPLETSFEYIQGCIHLVAISILYVSDTLHVRCIGSDLLDLTPREGVIRLIHQYFPHIL